MHMHLHLHFYLHLFIFYAEKHVKAIIHLNGHVICASFVASFHILYSLNKYATKQVQSRYTTK